MKRRCAAWGKSHSDGKPTLRELLAGYFRVHQDCRLRLTASWTRLSSVDIEDDHLRLKGAFEDGRLSGLDPTETVTLCPFPRQVDPFREAWLNGFTIGRIEAGAAGR